MTNGARDPLPAHMGGVVNPFMVIFLPTSFQTWKTVGTNRKPICISDFFREVLTFNSFHESCLDKPNSL